MTGIMHVHQGHVDRLLGGEPEAFVPTGRAEDAQALILEHRAHDQDRIDVVVDDEDRTDVAS